LSKVGDTISAGNSNWSFGGDVSEKFDEHVERSVPLYHEGHDLVARTCDFFLSDGSVCYELGCSTASLTRKIAERQQHRDIRLVGVDIEPGMIEFARSKCSQFKSIELIASDILDLEMEKSDVIICYYTLQFMRPQSRQIVFDRIYEALNWGGAFFCFEKVRAPDARFQDIMSALYVEYKMAQGYDAEEILGKARSLKGVLEPFSTSGNIDLMKRAGFVDIMTIFKYVSFEGFLAIK
jgi:tRNA (cmo5U34)-methyltransferase